MYIYMYCTFLGGRENCTLYCKVQSEESTLSKVSISAVHTKLCSLLLSSYTFLQSSMGVKIGCAWVVLLLVGLADLSDCTNLQVLKHGAVFL